MITDRAIEHMEQIAQAVGFGSRGDYPHLGATPISAGDWKGDSIAACVFSNRGHAEEYLNRCRSVLTALGDEPTMRVLTVVTPSGNEMYIAVITATDLVEKEEADHR